MRFTFFVFIAAMLTMTAVPVVAQEENEGERVEREKNEKQETKEEAVKTVNWESSFKEALDKAKKEDLLVMIYFYKTGSEVCEQFEKNSVNQPPIIELSGNFLCVKVGKSRNKDVFSNFGVSLVPSIWFIDQNQKRIGMIEGYEEPVPFAEKVKDLYESVKLEKEARETLRKNPDDLRANLTLAKVWEVRDYDYQAVELYKKVLASEPGKRKELLAEAAFRLGMIQYEKESFTEARESFDTARKYDPENEMGIAQKMLLTEVRMDIEEGDYGKALEGLDSFMNKYPESRLKAEAMFELGHVYYKKKEIEKAVETWEKLARDFPDASESKKAVSFAQQLKKQ